MYIEVSLLCVQGVKGSIGSFINLIMELKKCCNHAFLVRLPDANDETVDVDRFEVMMTLLSLHTHVHTHIPVVIKLQGTFHNLATPLSYMNFTSQPHKY